MQNVPYCSYNRTPGTLAFVEKMGQEHVEETEVDSSERLERRISLEREWVKGRVRYKRICPWMEVMRTLSWGCEHGNQIAVGRRVGGRWASEMVVSEKEERRAHSFRWLIYLDRRPLYAEGGEYLEERRDIWWDNISTWEKSPFWCLFVFHCIVSLKMICLLFLVEWYVAKHSVHKA